MMKIHIHQAPPRNSTLLGEEMKVCAKDLISTVDNLLTNSLYFLHSQSLSENRMQRKPVRSHIDCIAAHAMTS